MSRMSQDLLSQIDFNQLAAQLGTDPATAEQATKQALPMLLGSLASNAEQPGERQALAEAIARDHDGSVLDQGNVVRAVDPADGQAILGHVFGGRQNDVVQAFGSGSGLLSKLLPILAPLVLGWLGKRMGGGGSAGGGGGLGDILGDVLGGQVQQERQEQPDLGGLFDVLSGGGGAAGGGLDDLLGGLTGSGEGAAAGGLGGLLGGLLGGSAGGSDSSGGVGGLLGGLLGGAEDAGQKVEREDDVPDVRDIF